MGARVCRIRAAAFEEIRTQEVAATVLSEWLPGWEAAPTPPSSASSTSSSAHGEQPPDAKGPRDDAAEFEVLQRRPSSHMAVSANAMPTPQRVPPGKAVRRGQAADADSEGTLGSGLAGASAVEGDGRAEGARGARDSSRGCGVKGVARPQAPVRSKRQSVSGGSKSVSAEVGDGDVEEDGAGAGRGGGDSRGDGGDERELRPAVAAPSVPGKGAPRKRGKRSAVEDRPVGGRAGRGLGSGRTEREAGATRGADLTDRQVEESVQGGDDGVDGEHSGAGGDRGRATAGGGVEGRRLGSETSDGSGSSWDEGSNEHLGQEVLSDIEVSSHAKISEAVEDVGERGIPGIGWEVLGTDVPVAPVHGEPGKQDGEEQPECIPVDEDMEEPQQQLHDVRQESSRASLAYGQFTDAVGSEEDEEESGFNAGQKQDSSGRKGVHAFHQIADASGKWCERCWESMEMCNTNGFPGSRVLAKHLWKHWTASSKQTGNITGQARGSIHCGFDPTCVNRVLRLEAAVSERGMPAFGSLLQVAAQGPQSLASEA